MKTQVLFVSDTCCHQADVSVGLLCTAVAMATPQPSLGVAMATWSWSPQANVVVLLRDRRKFILLLFYCIFKMCGELNGINEWITLDFLGLMPNKPIFILFVSNKTRRIQQLSGSFIEFSGFNLLTDWLTRERDGHGGRAVQLRVRPAQGGDQRPVFPGRAHRAVPQRQQLRPLPPGPQMAEVRPRCVL